MMLDSTPILGVKIADEGSMRALTEWATSRCVRPAAWRQEGQGFQVASAWDLQIETDGWGTGFGVNQIPAYLSPSNWVQLTWPLRLLAEPRTRALLVYGQLPEPVPMITNPTGLRDSLNPEWRTPGTFPLLGALDTPSRLWELCHTGAWMVWLTTPAFWPSWLAGELARESSRTPSPKAVARGR